MVSSLLNVAWHRICPILNRKLSEFADRSGGRVMIEKKEGIYMKSQLAFAFAIILTFIISSWPGRFEDWSYAMADTTPPTVGVGNPRGGEVLTAGSTFTITWNSRDNVGVTSHDVLFSSNGGSTYSAIVTNLPDSAQNYTWTVPNTPTTAGKIRVVARDAAGNQGSGVSGTFTIRADSTAPSVTVTAPNGGEVLGATTTYTITWTASDNVSVASQDLFYSTNGGTSFSQITTNLGGDVRSFNWRVPCEPTAAGRIKVVARDAAGNEASDISNANFRISSTESTPPSVTVTFPNGGEVLTAGGIYVLTWDARDNVCVASQDLSYSANGGATFSLIAATVPGSVRSFSWPAPTTGTIAGRMKVVVRDAAGNQAEDLSDSNFTVQTGPPDTTPPSVTVTQPNGGETLASGSFYTITWTASDNVGVASQDVFFSADGGITFEPIATALPGGRRSHNWTVPSTGTTLGRIKVVARDAAGNQASDTSDYNFTIAVLPGDPIPPTVQVLSPNGGEILVTGSSYLIRWTSEDNNGVTRHDLLYSTDGGATFTSIVTNLSGIVKKYLWNTPSTVANALMIKVVGYDSHGNKGNDSSDLPCQVITSTDMATLRSQFHTKLIPEPTGWSEPGFSSDLQTGEYEETGEAAMEDTPFVEDIEDALAQPPDTDGDGLFDSIEDRLAWYFRPGYFWDQGPPEFEGWPPSEPGRFTHLMSGVTDLVSQGDKIHPSTPLIYYSVKYITDCRITHPNPSIGTVDAHIIRINYMAIFDRDYGLCAGGCNFKGAGGHAWDVERVELVVGLRQIYTLNDPDIYHYFIIGGWAYAHEGILCFHRKVWGQPLSNAGPGPFHAGTFWSRNKHGHFWGDPDGVLMWRCGQPALCECLCRFDTYYYITAWPCAGCTGCYDPVYNELCPGNCIWIPNPTICFVECFTGDDFAFPARRDLINVGDFVNGLPRPMNGATWIVSPNVKRAVAGSFGCSDIPRP
jgi:hypothetical protein